MPISPDTLILYGLCRTDMESMNRGKMVAQGMHAQAMMTDQVAIERMFGDRWFEAYQTWKKQGKQGYYGYTLTLDIDGPQLLAAVVNMAKRAGYPADYVTDESYPLTDGKFVHYIEVDTVGYLFGPQGELDIILRQFGLCP